MAERIVLTKVIRNPPIMMLNIQFYLLLIVMFQLNMFEITYYTISYYSYSETAIFVFS